MPRKPPPLDVMALRRAAAAEQSGRPPAPAELATLARACCAALAARHPGRNVELRVPPYAAVQLGVGETGAHRRGTPPNVVELSATTLIGLAAGTLNWASARDAHQVRASGVHSDLSAVFPLV